MILAICQGHWTVWHQISRKRYVISQKLLQSTNRNSYSSFRLVPLLMTSKYIFEGHISLGCYFHVHFSNLWQAFASRVLPAAADLFVSLKTSAGSRSNKSLKILNIIFHVLIMSRLKCNALSLPCDAMHCTVFDRNSVRLSVRPSVTLVEGPHGST